MSTTPTKLQIFMTKWRRPKST